MHLKQGFPHRTVSLAVWAEYDRHESFLLLMLIGALAGALAAVGGGLVAMMLALVVASHLAYGNLKPINLGKTSLAMLFIVAVGWLVGSILLDRRPNVTIGAVLLAMGVSVANGVLWSLLAFAGRIRDSRYFLLSCAGLALMILSVWILPRWLLAPAALVTLGAIHAYSAARMFSGKDPGESSAEGAAVGLVLTIPFIVMA